MKSQHIPKKLSLLVSLLLLGLNCSSADFDIRKPSLDGSGRFWLYTSGKGGATMPFVPYAWMPEQASQIMKMDAACVENPHVESGKATPEDSCISVTVNWAPPYWCGVAFLSGPDRPQWWGEDSRGWYYDLSGLKTKKLVFYARGVQGTERIQVKAGILGDKKYGDSLKFPAESRWLKLSKEWQRFELDLSGYRAEDLCRICNGFTFVLNKDQQADSNNRTQFFLDTIYFE